LVKDNHGKVNRVAIPSGACLPGNLLNVRTSAASYAGANGIKTPASPYMDPKTLIYTTSTDNIANGDLSVYQPGTGVNTITVYFALNYGLRNALDNPYDDSAGYNGTGNFTKTTRGLARTYGGYYVSNLTTALLGDASKGLGRATRAQVKLCFAPMSTLDRRWRKKSGDAKNNKQCLVEIANLVMPNAVTGLAVNDTAYPAYIDDASGVPAISPVAFCRPSTNASIDGFNNLSGVHPQGKYASMTDCVQSGTSWKVTKVRLAAHQPSNV
jgi:hypothetical protein